MRAEGPRLASHVVSPLNWGQFLVRETDASLFTVPEMHRRQDTLSTHKRGSSYGLGSIYDRHTEYQYDRLATQASRRATCISLCRHPAWRSVSANTQVGLTLHMPVNKDDAAPEAPMQPARLGLAKRLYKYLDVQSRIGRRAEMQHLCILVYEVSRTHLSCTLMPGILR